MHSYFALRKWSCEPDARGVLRFCLNGKPILLNGLLDQGYWPQGLYTPPSDAAVERELSEVKALGFNLLRKHAKNRAAALVLPLRQAGPCGLAGHGERRQQIQPVVRHLPDQCAAAPCAAACPTQSRSGAC